jgi:hypothetical protein
MAPKNKYSFTLAAYRSIVESLLSLDYEVHSFEDAVPEKRHLILRHDIDMSLSAAVEMARVESSIGVNSTYFILLRSEFYNPWTPKSVKFLSEIEAIGHNIGLHLDASLYDESDLEEKAEQEIQLLETLLGHQIKMVSFHRPAPKYVGSDHLIAGHSHAYRPRYIEEIGYCSDSRGGWHHGHPEDHEAVKNGRALQLLTHPLWWITNGQNPQEKLVQYCKDCATSLDQELSVHCSVHTPIPSHAAKRPSIR